VTLHEAAARFGGTRTVKALFWVAALFALVMALLPHPPNLPGNPSDKIQHVTAFATLGLLGGLAYRRIPTVWLIAALSLFGALIELLQLIPSLHRDSDALDWIADTIACTLVLVTLRWWQGRRR
jgi:VanZ family protein